MENSIKQLFFSLDKFAYSIARWAYKIFLQLAEINLSGDETSGKILRKIYVLVFFVMVFIISYSLLTYIVNPDKTSDSKTGTTSLVQKVLISLGVIVASPFIFSELYYVQHLVLQSHLIENVILGGHSYKKQDTSIPDDEASINFMIASVYTSFLHPKDEEISSWDCLQDDLNGGNNNNSSEDSEDFEDSNYFKLYCVAYENVYQTGDISKFENFVSNDNFTYMWLISFAAGIILAFFTLSFCVNLGVRAFKLLILEILAPVPALVELLPSKSGTLQKYFEEVFKVFADLFIYQAVILGTMWLLTLVPSILSDLFKGASITRTWAYIILIFSFMRFAREVPQLLTDIFGLKSTGVLRATGLRALNMAAGAGLFAGGAITSLARNAVDTYRNERADNRNQGRSIGAAALSGLAGAAGATRRNIWRARNAQNINDIRNVARNTNNEVQERRLSRRRNNENLRNRYNVDSNISAHAHDIFNRVSRPVDNFFNDPRQAMTNAGDRIVGTYAYNAYGGNTEELDNLYNSINRAHIDDNANRLGEINTQRRDLAVKLAAAQNEQATTAQGTQRYNELDAQIREMNAQIAAYDTAFENEFTTSSRRNVTSLRTAVQEIRSQVDDNDQLRQILSQNQNGYTVEDLDQYIDRNGTFINLTDDRARELQNIVEAFRGAVREQRDNANVAAIGRHNANSNNNNNNNNNP